MRLRLSWVVMILIAAASITTFWFLRSPSTEADDAAADRSADDAIMEKARAFYDERPYYQQPMPYSETPEGLASMTAESCGACHQSIYKEWQISTHARAWKDDAQFLEELKKSRSEPPHEDNGDVGWMCVNCHTPMMNQLPQLVVGLEDGDISKPIYAENPYFDEAMQDDAITCATCHVRDGKILGPYGSEHAPHPVKKDTSLTTEKTCVRCHQAEALFPDQNLGCFFTTGSEWTESEFGQKGEACQTCHMPMVERHVADNYEHLPKRMTRRHWFGGSLIAKHPEFVEELEPLKEIYGDGVELELRRANEPCEKAQPCTRIAIDIVNSNAGHHVPSGDPERHLEIEARALRNGEEIAIAEQWVGSRYKWWPKIELVESNRIPAGEKLTFHLDVPAEPPFVVEVVGEKYRMYEEAFEHHELEGRYVRGREFERKQFEVSDAVRLLPGSDEPGKTRDGAEQAGDQQDGER